MSTHVVYGNWKLRFDEPCDRSVLTLIQVSLPNQSSIVCDIRNLDVRSKRSIREGKWSQTTAAHDAQNLNGGDAPLALAKVDGDNIVITHLILRVEVHLCHFLSVPSGAHSTTVRGVLGSLVALFGSNHLNFNNFECGYYPLANVFASRDLVSYGEISALALTFSERLANGEVEGFFRHIGREFGMREYDETQYRPIKPEGEASRLVLVSHYSRAKRVRDRQRLATVTTALHTTGEEDSPPEEVELEAGDEEAFLSERYRTPLEISRRHLTREVCLGVESSSGILFEVVFSSHLPTGEGHQPTHFAAIRSVSARTKVALDIVSTEGGALKHCILGMMGEGDARAQSASVQRQEGLPSRKATRVALIGPSGSGKSTAAAYLVNRLASHGCGAVVQKLATPLYDVQHALYQRMDIDFDYTDQDQKLLEELARQIRRIDPGFLVEDFLTRCGQCSDKVIINDDLRDVETDLPALRSAGFVVVRIVAADVTRAARLSDRRDRTVVLNSKLDEQLARMTPDYLIPNNGNLDDFHDALDVFLDEAMDASAAIKAQVPN